MIIILYILLEKKVNLIYLEYFKNILADYNKFMTEKITKDTEIIIKNYIELFIRISFKYPTLVSYILSSIFINENTIEYNIIKGISDNFTLYIDNFDFNDNEIKYLGYIIRNTPELKKLYLTSIFIIKNRCKY